MRTREEEVVNALTHLLWAILSALVFVLVVLSERYDLFDKIIILLMSGMSSWAFYTSFLYHNQKDDLNRARNRIVDKAGIYLMIMGCGISLNMASPQAALSIPACILISLAGSGCIVNLCLNRNATEAFSVFTYIMLGWLSAIPASGILGTTIYVETSTLWYIVGGGLLYSIGVIFYSKDSLKWNHTWWHIFVMAGYCMHLFAQLKALSIT
tara:strand:- start:448 stop:1080 length:633 start_codon:yes stop_codon:yes gene_type:complete